MEPPDVDLAGVPDATVMSGFSIGWIQHVKELRCEDGQIVMVCDCSNRVELGPTPSPEDVKLADASCEQYMQNYLNYGPTQQVVPTKICTVDAALWIAEKVARESDEDNRVAQALVVLADRVRQIRVEVS